MRLRGIKTIEEANVFLETYLPEYNSRFAVEPRESADLHRKVSRGLDLHSILCIKTERRLNNDFTVAYYNKFYQIEDKVKTETVLVEERLDGTMAITHNGLVLTYRELPERPKKQSKLPIAKKRSSHTVSADHPWRRLKTKPWGGGKWKWAKTYG